MRAGRTSAKCGLLSAAMARKLAIEGSGSSFSDTALKPRLTLSTHHQGRDRLACHGSRVRHLFLFVVAAELEAHGRKQPILKISRTPRAEALEEGCRQHVRRYTFR